MINPGQHNFTLCQGTTLRKTFSWVANDLPVDLTGYTGRCQFRTSYQDVNVAVNMTSLNGGILIDELNGTITLFASDTLTAALMHDKYLYDLEVIDPVGDVSRLIYGVVMISKEITR